MREKDTQNTFRRIKHKCNEVVQRTADVHGAIFSCSMCDVVNFPRATSSKRKYNSGETTIYSAETLSILADTGRRNIQIQCVRCRQVSAEPSRFDTRSVLPDLGIHPVYDPS